MDELQLKNKKSSATKCTSCGGTLQFSIKNQALQCLHCESVISFAGDEKPVKKDFDKVEDEFNSWNKESILIKCSVCGAKEVVNNKSIASSCSFCGSSKLVSTKELPGLKPDAVVPFKVTQEQSTKNFTKWLKKKWFTPKGLKKSAIINDFNGVYSPTWNYDTDTLSTYSGVLERRKTRTNRDGRTEVYYVPVPVRGSREDQFLDLLMPVGQKIDRLNFDRIQPFYMKESKVYDKNYLSGFSANHYSVNAKEAWKGAKTIMKNTITHRILRRHNADRVRTLSLNTKYNNTKYNYSLLPIWVCNYYFKEKLYNFFINGQTGEVSGKVPRSAFKITLFVLFIVTLFILAAVFGGQ